MVVGPVKRGTMSFLDSDLESRGVQAVWQKTGRGIDRATWLGAWLGFCLWQGLASASWGYNPDSPEVRQMVDRALKFLETNNHHAVGGNCLIGLAFYKAGADTSHPKVAEAVKQAAQLAAQVRKSGVGANCYNEAVACIFLCEVVPDRNRAEIESLVYGLVQRQTADGMWTYQVKNQPDTSQTQYAILALWSAHVNGVTVPPASLERGLAWLLRTQFRDGSFCYWPAEGPPQGERNAMAAQATLSMTVAGVGALYAGASVLGISRQPAKDRKLPPALQRVPKNEAEKYKLQRLDPAALLSSCAQGDAWISQHFGPENADPRWTCYYLYGLERYASLKELIEGKIDKDPAWYNAIVGYLQKTQKDSGAWDAGFIGAPCDTAFCALFLLRSMQKTIKKSILEEGVLVGGHGLPRDLTNARLQDGKVVTPQMVRDVDDLMELLKNAEDKEFDAMALPGGLSLDADLTKRTSQLERLRALVTNEDFDARLAAVKTLARSRDLDNVPALIYALSDPDARIVREARDGLRFISRKFAGFGLPDNPTVEQKQAARAKWKAWYRSIRPDGELMD